MDADTSLADPLEKGRGLSVLLPTRNQNHYRFVTSAVMEVEE
jgi:hypothetical protein